MNKKNQSKGANLRSKAEELLNKELKKTIAQLSEAEIYKLLHELQVQQVELQLQNEELILAREEALTATEKYTELYDFAPMGYLTLSRKGEILQLNLTASKMLGKDRSQLIKQLFRLYISDSTKPSFLQFQEKIFESKVLETCELSLEVESRKPAIVHLTGQVSADNERYFITLTDITESKLAHLALLKSDKRYLALIDNLEAGIVVHAPDTSILLNNDKAIELLGLTSDQMRGKTAIDPDWKFVDQNKTPLELRDYPVNRVVKSRQPIKNQILGIIHPGKSSPVWVSVNGLPLLNSHGELTEIVISFIDISNRKNAENKLLEKDALLNITGKTAKVGGWEFDAETKNQTWTDEVYALHEVDLKFNPNVENGVNFYAPWSKPIINQALSDAIEMGKPFDLELELITKKDRHLWVRSIGEAKQENGKTIQVYGSIQDITDRKKAEEASRVNSSRLELAMQTANMAWWEMDITSGNVIFDKHKTEMIGFAAEDFKHYSDFMALVHPDDSEKAMIAMKNHIYGQAEKYETEYRILTNSGEYRWFHDIGTIAKRGLKGAPLSVLGIVTDITQSKLEKEKLDQSEQRFELLSEQSGVGMALYSPEGKILYLNQKAVVNLGGKPEDFVGKSLREVFGNEIGQVYIERITKVINLRENCIYEDYLESPSGKYWFSSILSVVYNNEGALIGVQAVSHDTTERKLAEAALAQSRSELKAIYELSPVMMCLVDKNRKVIFANKEFSNLTGTDQEQLKGGHACGVFGCINALDDSRGCGFGTKCQQCNLRLAMEDTLKNGTGHTNVEYHTTLIKNGETREVILLGSTALIESNEHRNLLLCLNDITERKHAEEEIKKTGQHYQALIEKAPDGVALIGKEGNFTYISPSAKKMFGYLELNEEIGHPDEYTHPDDLPVILAELKKILENPAYTPTLQYRFKHKHGYWRWIETTFSNLLAHPSVESIVLNFRDITERKLMDDTQTFLLQISNPGSDENFFESLAKFLSKSLDMEYVCIDILEGDGLTAKTLAIYNEGNFDPNVSYALKDTPCGEVVGNQICCFPREVRRLFPNDSALEDIKAESYIGTTLRNFDGKAIGLIAVIGQNPLENKGLAESILKQVSIRAAGKLEATLAEKRLKESEEKFRVLIESTSVAIYLTDLNGKCTYVNPKWCEIAQLSSIDAIGDGWVNGIYEEDREKVFENWQKMVASDGNWGFEYRFGTPEKLSWVFGTAKSYKNDSGQIVGFIGSNIDITERKQAEEELISSEKKFRQIAENIKEVFWISAPDWSKIYYISPAYNNVWGEDAEKLYHEPFLWMDAIIEEDKEKTRSVIPKTITKDISEIIFPDYRITKSDGAVRWISARAFPIFDSEGNPYRIAGIAEDITERKQAEEALLEKEHKYRTLFETAEDAILLFTEGVWIDCNDSALKVYGCSREQIIGAHPNRFSPPLQPDGKSSDEEAIKKIDRAFSGEPQHFEWLHCRYDGTSFAAEVKLNRLDLDGKPYIQAIVRDISERKQAEEEKQENQALLAGILNSSLSGIMAFKSVRNDKGIIIDFEWQLVNAAAEQMVARKQAELVGKRLLEEMPGNRKDDLFNLYVQVVETGIPLNHEHHYEHEKVNAWFQTVAVKRFDGIVVTFTDITERKLSEAVFRDIIEKNPMSIQILDMEGYPIQVNSAHTKLFGIKPPTNYSVFKDPQLLLKGFGEYFEQIKKGEIVYLPDSYYNVHDLDPMFPDNPVWVRAIAFTLNDNSGTPERIVFMHENITERKHSEDFLTDIIEKNPMSVQITDQEGHTIHVNPAFTKLFGAVPPPDFSIFDDLKTKSKELEQLIALAKSGEVVHLPDIYFNPHDEVPEAPDNPCWVRALIFPLKDSGGKIERFVFMHENITESKLSEAELHEREIQYQNLANSGPAMIWTAGTDMMCTYFNETWLSFTGRRLEQVLGDGWTRDVHPDDLDGCMKIYMNAFDRHENFEIEYRLKHASGEYRWIMDMGTPNYDSKGEFVGYIGNCFDITERKRVEDDLNKNEERLRDIIKSAGDWVWEVDKNGIYTYSSNQSIDLLGRTPDEIIGKSPFDSMPDEEAERIAVLFNDIVEHKLPITDLENWNITKSGERICILTNGFPMFDKSGNLTGYRGVDKDITKRKQIEQKLLDSEYEFRSLAESMPQIVWSTRPDGWNIFFNQQWVNYTGLTLEESYGHGWNKPFHPDDQQRAWEAWKNATTNLVTYSVECRLRRFDGEYRWWLIRGVPVRNDQGEVINWFGTCTDIHDIKLSAKELLEAKEHAEQSDRLKSSFLANMSHEIRTPLNSIIGFSDLLNDPDYNEEQKSEFTKTIIENGNNLMVIISDILDLSMIAAGQLIIRLEHFSPQKLLVDLANEFSIKAKAKGIDLRLSVQTETPEIIIENDSSRTRQILINLIGNAIKFTSQGYVEFGYLIKGDTIEFRVRDTGIGIATEHFDAIFDRFRQLEITKTRRFGGNGLGLPISKNLVELLGGKIWLESEVGKGSTFYLSLPILYKSNENIDFPNKIETSSQEIQIRNMKILIAEDEEDSSKLMTIDVRKFAYEIIYAKTGIEAIESCRNNPDIDLILMDIQMPEMDGYEATREIRKFNPEVVIIAQTAFALSGDREIAINSGCSDYISKPIKRDKLMELLQKYFSE